MTKESSCSHTREKISDAERSSSKRRSHPIRLWIVKQGEGNRDQHHRRCRSSAAPILALDGKVISRGKGLSKQGSSNHSAASARSPLRPHAGTASAGAAARLNRLRQQQARDEILLEARNRIERQFPRQGGETFEFNHTLRMRRQKRRPGQRGIPADAEPVVRQSRKHADRPRGSEVQTACEPAAEPEPLQRSRCDACRSQQ